ncbi:MAG: PQQ-like beta-propeller repeat protein [Sedimentisphaerales bacterium]|nr:PQQ-like beta-propeller repeat protein [Sedimentisphaerales bacterium]
MGNRIVLSGCLIVLAAGLAFGQDWPQWLGPQRDGVATFSAPQTWPAKLVQKWSVNVGTGDATPVLVGDKVYVFARQGNEEVTLCLNAGDGKEVWKDHYEAQAVTGAAARHPGPRSTPIVAGAKIVTLGVGGVLSCLDAESGKLIWRKDPFPKVVPRFFTSMSPLVVDGKAIAHLGGAGNGGMIAYDLATGQEKWRWGGEGPDYGSPVLLAADGVKQIVTLTEKSVVAVNAADGKLLWSLPFVPAGRAYNSVTPIVDGQTVIYAGAGRGTTAVKVEKQGDTFVTRELWKNADLAPQYNTPVLKDGMLFGLSNSGKFYCIDAKTGDTKWADSTSYDRSGFGQIVDAGSCLVALSSNGELMIFKPTGEKYEELARIKVSDTPTYACPVLSGKRIFIKDQDTVTLWTID